MKKLTAEKCRELVKQLRASRDVFGPLPEKEDYKLQALEIALPILEQQERGDGEGEWIEWGGDQCPVDSDAIVETKWSDGDKIINRAGVFHWHHVYGPNIIAYRIIPKQPTNQTGEQ